MAYKKNGFWYFSYRDIINGKTKAVSTRLVATKQNKSLAIQRENEYKKILQEENSIYSSTTITLPQLLQLYIKTKHSKELANSTIRSYSLAIDHFVKACGEIEVNRYSKADYTKFLVYLNSVITDKGTSLSVDTISLYTRNLHALFNFAIEQELIQKNIIKVTPRGEKDIETITDEDFNQLLNYFKERKRNRKHYYILQFAFLTAFRKSTIAALNWEHIDFPGGFITAPNIKGKRNVLFPLTSDILRILDSYGIKQSGSVFGLKDGESFKFFDRAIKKLGMNYTFHQIRKTGITAWIDMETSIFDVQQLAMHKDVKTTSKYYTKVNMNRIKEDLQKKKDQKLSESPLNTHLTLIHENT